MATANTYQASNKILLAAAFAAVFAIAGSAFVLYYLGTFSNVILQKTELPSYRLAYVLNTGPYNKIDDVFEKVKVRLAENNIQPIHAAAVFLDDPSVVAGDQLRSKVGFVISRYDQLPEALQSETWEAVEVIQAKFEGSPVVGSSKAYRAMKYWCEDNAYLPALPSVEVYLSDDSIEYYLPISKRQ